MKVRANNHTKKRVTVNGVNGYVIAPEGFAGTLADSYLDDAALAADNLVFLPVAGNRFRSDIYEVDSYGYYWSFSAYGGDYAHVVAFDSVYVDQFGDRCYYGNSARLVTDSVKQYKRPQIKVLGVNITNNILNASITGNENIGLSSNSYTDDDFDQE